MWMWRSKGGCQSNYIAKSIKISFAQCLEAQLAWVALGGYRCKNDWAEVKAWKFGGVDAAESNNKSLFPATLHTLSSFRFMYPKTVLWKSIRVLQTFLLTHFHAFTSPLFFWAFEYQDTKIAHVENSPLTGFPFREKSIGKYF